MSALTPLPPDVEKMWITVDKTLFPCISRGRKGFFNREECGGSGKGEIYPLVIHTFYRFIHRNKG
jgi:hypothetical protein